MDGTGVVRRVDDLGRIVLPKELRSKLEINERDAMEIYVVDDDIILHKHRSACIFCGSLDELHSYHGKNICESCARDITSEIMA